MDKRAWVHGKPCTLAHLIRGSIYMFLIPHSLHFSLFFSFFFLSSSSRSRSCSLSSNLLLFSNFFFLPFVFRFLIYPLSFSCTLKTTKKQRELCIKERKKMEGIYLSVLDQNRFDGDGLVVDPPLGC